MQLSMMIDSLWVFATRLVMRAANFVVFILLARTLSLEDFGVYGYVVASLLMLSVIFDCGLRQAAAAAIGEVGKDRHDTPNDAVAGRDEAAEARARVVGQLAGLWLLLSLGCAVAMALMMLLGGHAGMPLVTLAAALSVVPALLVRTGQGIFLGRGQIPALNRSELVSRAVLLVGTLLLWLLGLLTLERALLLLLVSHVCAGFFLIWQIRDTLFPLRPFERVRARQLLRSGLTFAGGIIAMIMLGRVGVWVVQWVASDAEVGLYFGALRLAEMLAEVATAVGVVIFSHGVRAHESERAAHDAAAIARCVGSSLALSSLLLMLLAAPLLALTLGPAYAAEAHVLRILLLGAAAGSYSMMLYPTLSSRGYAKDGAVIFWIGTALAFALGWLMTATGGLTGAAQALAIAQVVTAAGFIIACHRRFDIPIAALLLPQAEDFGRARAMVRQLAGRRQRA